MKKSTVSFHIRDAKTSDMERVHELVCELATFERAPNEVKTTPQVFQDDFAKGRFSCFVAQEEENNTVIGFALYFPRYSTWKGHCIYLEDLVVEEAFRGQGIGSALINAVAAKAKEQDAARMQWQCLDWNARALTFYREKLGAHTTSEWIDCKLTRDQLLKKKSE